MKNKISKGMFLSLALTFLSVGSAVAQTTSYWNNCSGGTQIVRCETYNCPKGDTNKDGRCSLSDEQATQTDSRNDSFCANPPSNCGEVLYFPQNSTNSCAIRVKETNNNCTLYRAGNPTVSPSPTAVSTPTPTVRPTSTPVASVTVRPTATATSIPRLPVSSPAVSTGSRKPATLPKTGAALWISIFLAGAGLYGVWMYEKSNKQSK